MAILVCVRETQRPFELPLTLEIRCIWMESSPTLTNGYLQSADSGPKNPGAMSFAF